MEDRHLFKAKDNKEWVRGSLVYTFTGTPYIVTEYDHIMNFININEVDPSTICQCTGLKDKNGKLIWENDIANTAFLIWWLDNLNYSPMYPWKEKIQIVGNKFDNKDLLEKEFFE